MDRETCVFHQSRITGTDIWIARGRAGNADECKIGGVGCVWLEASGRQREGGLSRGERVEGYTGVANDELDDISGLRIGKRIPCKGVIKGRVDHKVAALPVTRRHRQHWRRRITEWKKEDRAREGARVGVDADREVAVLISAVHLRLRHESVENREVAVSDCTVSARTGRAGKCQSGAVDRRRADRNQRPELKRLRGIDNRDGRAGLLKVLYLPVDETTHVLREAGGGGDGEREKEERPTHRERMWTAGFHARPVLANETHCLQLSVSVCALIQPVRLN